MTDKTMTLEIISADDVLYSGEVQSVTLPGEMGKFTVLKDHAPIISVLVKGAVVLRDSDGKEKSFDVKGGLVDVNDNRISVCVY